MINNKGKNALFTDKGVLGKHAAKESHASF